MWVIFTWSLIDELQWLKKYQKKCKLVFLKAKLKLILNTLHYAIITITSILQVIAE